jgi:hypothetical protein
MSHAIFCWFEGTVAGQPRSSRVCYWLPFFTGRKLQNNQKNSKQLYQVLLLHGAIMYVNLTISFLELFVVHASSTHNTFDSGLSWVFAHFCRFFVSCFHSVVSEMVHYIISNISWQKFTLFLRKWIPPPPPSHGIIVRHVRTWNGFFAPSVVTEWSSEVDLALGPIFLLVFLLSPCTLW